MGTKQEKQRALSTRGMGFGSHADASIAPVTKTMEPGPVLSSELRSPEDIIKAAMLEANKRGQKLKFPNVPAVNKSAEAEGPDETPSDESADEEKDEAESADNGDGDDTPDEPAEETVEVKSVELSEFLNVVTASLDEVKALSQELVAANEKIAELERDRESDEVKVKESASAVALADVLSKLSGTSVTKEMPNISKITNPLAHGPSGVYKEYLDALGRAPVRIYGAGDDRRLVRDTAAMDRLAARDLGEIKRQVERSMKDRGLLSGGGVNGFVPNGQVEKAPTAIADLAGQFLPILSTIMRLSNTHQYVFHNWIWEEYVYGVGRGVEIHFGRNGVVLQRPTRESDRLLSGGDTFVPISTNSVPMQSGSIPAILQEYGLGRVGVGEPIAYIEFVDRYTLDSLLFRMRQCLYEDYLYWRDLQIRSKFRRTSRVLWNKAGTTVDDPSTLAAGDGGQLTHDLVTEATMYLETLGVPRFPGGYYVLVAPSMSLAPYIKSIDTFLRTPNVEQTQIVRSVISSNTNLSDTIGEESQLTSGLVGIDGNTIIIRSNAFGSGAPGTEGVQAETIAGNTVITRSCYMFGAGAVARGVGMPFEIRTNLDPYERSRSAIWLEHSACVALDVDSLNTERPVVNPRTGEQTRVVELRVTDGAI